MAKYTENYNLKKPAQEDFYNVDDFNNNADIIDSQLKAVSDKAAAALPATSYTAADILNKLKTVDGINSGLDADLFKGKSVIPVANGGTGATTATTALTNLGAQAKLGFTPVQQGGGTGQKTNKIYMGWTGSKLNVQVDSSNQGAVVFENTLNSLMQSALQSGGVSVVKSVQRGVIKLTNAYSVSATINAVNTNKAVVIYGGNNVDASTNNKYFAYLKLTNSTTVTATNASGSSGVTNVPYQVIEFY